MKTTFIKILIIILPLLYLNSCKGDDENTSIPTAEKILESTIVKFSHNGKNYEIVKKNKTWANAATSAANRGGFLVEINDAEEQEAIFSELADAAIDLKKTLAQDGGGNDAYIWIGANDFTIEGDWVWDGNNDSNSTLFWRGKGDTDGAPINGLYSNWGNLPTKDYKEPDNGGFGQDVAAISLDGFLFGSAGQWNDINSTRNKLYYIVEFD